MKNDITDLVSIQDCLKIKQIADSEIKDQMYSKHIGYLFGGKATLIINFDAEPRFTTKEWEEMNQMSHLSIKDIVK